MKTGCAASFQISARVRDGRSFLEVSKAEMEHNHPLNETDFKVYPANQRLHGEELEAVNNLVS